MIFLGEPGGIRTHGPKIKSLVLYQLSYGLAGGVERHAPLPVKHRRRLGWPLFYVGRHPHVDDLVRIRHGAAAATAALDLIDELHA